MATPGSFPVAISLSKNSVMSCSFSGAGADASAASAAPPALVQCATKAATKAKRRALGAPTELNALPMVAALNFHAKKGFGPFASIPTASQHVPFSAADGHQPMTA